MSQRAGRPAVSLFTGAGIGDLGFRSAGLDFVVMSELEPDRAELAKLNFPEAEMVQGDVWSVADSIVDATRTKAAGEIFLLSCTAPCQGMSKNGQGTLLRNVRNGNRPRLDPRNRLILPALEVIEKLRPRWVVFENVSEMAWTVIEDVGGNVRPILDIIEEALAPDYVGAAYDLEFADYGIAQRRRRLITVYTRDPRGQAFFRSGGALVPAKTHAQRPGIGQLPWVSVGEAIKGFPPLDAGSPESARSELPFHRVPLLDARKYAWVSATPPNGSAFDNQCAACGYDRNPTHGAARNEDGINRAKTTTPIYCEACGALLPRPSVDEADGTARIMKGYTSAYKRMSADLPAPALTRNLSYACSDQKLHPTQNRVLSLAEAFTVHSVSEYTYAWGNGKPARHGLIALMLGESIPPRLTELLARHLVSIAEGTVTPASEMLHWPGPVVPRPRQSIKSKPIVVESVGQMTAWE